MTRQALVQSICDAVLQHRIGYADTETTDDVFDAGIGPYHGTTYMWRPGRTPTKHIGSRVFGVALADVDMRACFVYVYDPEFAMIRKVLASRRVTLVWHNYNYDKIQCDVSGIRVRAQFEDTLLMARLWDDSRPHGLKALYEQLTGQPPEEEQDLKNDLRRKKAASTRAGHPKGFVNYSFADRRIMDRYACGDVTRTGVLYEFFSRTARNDAFDILYERDKACVQIAVGMTHAGIGFDAKQARHALHLSQAAERKLRGELCKRARTHGLKEFAPSKAAQVRALLIAEGYPSCMLAKEGRDSTGKECLKGLSLTGIESDTPQLILDHRRVSKLNSTYLTPLTSYARDAGGDIHAQWSVGGARTGRYSSNSPNLQNISRKDTQHTDNAENSIRAMFVPRPGHVNIYVDYSQVELRYLAAVSQDPAMLEAYRAGSDLHALTSVRLGITRQEAKPVNFGIVYGEGAAALAASLGIPFARAAYFIKSWFDAFPSVKEKQEHLQKELHYNGFVSDFFGRQYRYPKSAPHKCINAVIQGGCATILKCAMVSVAEMIRHMPGVRILECIHDELCIEVPEARYSKNFVRQVCRRMEDVPEFTQHGVELIVEPSVAYDNWANKQAIENWR